MPKVNKTNYQEILLKHNTLMILTITVKMDKLY